jgi:hypothetical protein
MITTYTLPRRVYSSQADLDRRAEYYRILGVNLTEAPGINTLLLQTWLAEGGLTYPSFAPPLRLLPGCPVPR